MSQFRHYIAARINWGSYFVNSIFLGTPHLKQNMLSFRPLYNTPHITNPLFGPHGPGRDHTSAA